jgi:hypothetical protein
MFRTALKNGFFYKRNTRTGAVARPAGGELDVLWISRSSTSKPRSAPRGFGPVSGTIPQISAQWGTPYRTTQGGCSAPNTARATD